MALASEPIPSLAKHLSQSWWHARRYFDNANGRWKISGGLERLDGQLAPHRLDPGAMATTQSHTARVFPCYATQRMWQSHVVSVVPLKPSLTSWLICYLALMAVKNETPQRPERTPAIQAAKTHWKRCQTAFHVGRSYYFSGYQHHLADAYASGTAETALDEARTAYHALVPEGLRVELWPALDSASCIAEDWGTKPENVSVFRFLKSQKTLLVCCFCLGCQLSWS